MSSLLNPRQPYSAAAGDSRPRDSVALLETLRRLIGVAGMPGDDASGDSSGDEEEGGVLLVRALLRMLRCLLGRNTEHICCRLDCIF